MEHLTLTEMITIDSSIWVALFDENDSCHEEAIKIIENLNSASINLIEHIYAEVLTVLRNKKLTNECQKFIDFLKAVKIKIKFLNKNSFTLANFLFFQFKKLSFTDCFLMSTAVLEKAQLMTFDKAIKKAWKSML